MKSTQIVCAALSLLLGTLLPCTALAQESLEVSETGEPSEIDYASSGVYVWLGLGIGASTKAEDQISAIASIIAGFPVPVEVSSSVGFNGRLGSAGKIISSELQFEYLPSFEASTLGITAAEWSIFTMTGNLKAQLPLGRFQPYALFGGGFTRSATSSGLIAGI